MVTIIGLLSCNGDEKETQIGDISNPVVEVEKQVPQASGPVVTFVELGSVNCIPCKKMQPIMKSIEAKYEDQIEVIFYDVWQEDQKPKAKEYGIRLIPTQVFLDAAGVEIFRHEGFFPEEEIDKFLQAHGLKIRGEM